MDNQTDDRDPDRRPGGTPGELEEALKWLEELTARQGKPAELSNPIPAASLDSPFRGLIDSDEGDLPDWLREVPSPSGSHGQVESEPESRLDWLAKMAQRESIEELPTLEWRRLSEPAQSAILADRANNLQPEPSDLSSVAPEIVPDETPDSGVDGEFSTINQEEAPREIAEGIAELPVAEASFADETAEEPLEKAQIVTDIVSEPVEVEVESLVADDFVDFSTPESEDTIPPMDDLDAAMAWIEELAASQDAPIEDLPSVADRALASKLMVEAGLTPNISPLDELGSDSSLVESLTPTHPFIEEEDFADTVVLVETLVADQGTGEIAPEEDSHPAANSDIPPIADTGTVDFPADTTVTGETTSYEEPPAELSFEDAMAFLDEMAVVEPDAALDHDLEPIEGLVDEEPALLAAGLVGELQSDVVPESNAIGVSVESVDAKIIDDTPLSQLDESSEALLMETPIAPASEEIAEILDAESPRDEFMPWIEESEGVVAAETDSAVVESEFKEGWEVDSLNGRGYSDLEVALRSLDALALPPGKSLVDIDTTLRTAQVAPWRDVNSALDWLEATLTDEAPATHVPPAELDEEALIAQMPEDPDAVLAWLEQMAEEEDSEPAAVPTYELPTMAMTEPMRSEPLVEEQAEADLLNMPEDPDEAMAWLEGLARESKPVTNGTSPAVVEPVADYQPDIPSSPEPDAGTSPEGLAVDWPSEPVLDESPVEHFTEAVVPEEVVENSGPVYPEGEMLESSDEAILTQPVHVVVEEIEQTKLDAPVTAELAETEPQAVTQPARPASKRRRSRAATQQADAEQASEEEPAAPLVKADEPPALSWIDLLKPLD